MNKKIPKFKSIKEEAKFWDNHDVADYLAELKPIKIEVNLKKPKNEILTIRLQQGLKLKLEKSAQRYGINLSTLARIWLIDKLREIENSKITAS